MKKNPMKKNSHPTSRRPALWVKPRPGSQMLGLSYDKTLRLAEQGLIPVKEYFLANGQKRYLISLAWIMSNSEGGRVA